MNTINSTIKGKAFEYACLLAIKETIETIRPVRIEKNSSYIIAKDRFEHEIDIYEQKEMLSSAKVGINSIIEMEPKIIEDGNDALEISLQPDTTATKYGDVRDVLIIRRNINWEIGISVKHNHSALKHSRLSRTLDFGKVWLDKNCSEEYFSSIAPIFNLWDEYKNENLKWSELESKEDEIYIPLLNSFREELYNINSNGDIAVALIKYLIGSNGKDYYKLISNNNRTTTVIPFNLFGTLNQAANTIQPKINIPKIKLPTKILDFSFKEGSKTTLILTLNNCWVISFRIHNASTYVESSLKFDIQLKGMPSDIFYINKAW
ncbi:MAG: HaeIII family restriction endonuclease [Bacteroidales bacterium]|nr:HaeIII family restriction endonuclease [Bacteroidales bacterium]